MESLVAIVYSQESGVDYSETLHQWQERKRTTQGGWILYQLDVKFAFLN